MSKVLSEDLDKIFGEWYIQVSKPMIKIFGLEAAVMLCNLYSEYRYWKTKGKLTGYGTFYSTVENVEHNTGLGKRQQLRAIDVLETYGIIKKSLHDLPPKRYFRFLEEGVKKLGKDVRKEKKKKWKNMGLMMSFVMMKIQVKYSLKVLKLVQMTLKM